MKPRDVPAEELARLLATGKTHAETARALGISESTVWRRLRDDPGVRRAVVRERSALVSQISDRVIAAALEATDVLIGIARDEQAPYSARVRASSELLARCLTYRVVADSD